MIREILGTTLEERLSGVSFKARIMVRVLELDTVRALFLLRVVVAAIGERTSPPWWRTQFLTDVGLRTMTRIFPRTGIPSGIESASKAARVEHDTRIGNGRYHLFHLPEPVESGVIAVAFEDKVNEELSPLFTGGEETLLARLESLVNGRAVKSAEGPVSLGDSSRLWDRMVVEEVAACYRSAVLGSSRCYPYFEAGKESL